MSTQFMEIAIMWPGKKSVASGRVNVPVPITLADGDQLVIQRIEYKERRPEKAPEFRLSVVKDRDTGNGGGDHHETASAACERPGLAAVG